MKGRWPITLMCEVLEVSPSGYFGWEAGQHRERPSPRRSLSDEALLAHMRAIHEQLRAEYGWPRMHKELLARGHRVGKERVRQLMQRHGLRAKGKRKFVVTTDSAHRLPIAADLVQRRFIRQRRIDYGLATSPTFQRTKAGCTWPRSSTSTAVRSWAGVCSRTCRPR